MTLLTSPPAPPPIDAAGGNREVSRIGVFGDILISSIAASGAHYVVDAVQRLAFLALLKIAGAGIGRMPPACLSRLMAAMLMPCSSFFWPVKQHWQRAA